MKKVQTLALALVALALMGTEVMAQTQTINLNTGYNQVTSLPIPVNQPDPDWKVIVDSTNPPPANGRPADVVPDIWSVQKPVILTEFQNSRWVSVGPGPAHRPLNSLATFEFHFTLPPGFSNPQLTMKLRADDIIFQVMIGNTLFTGGSGNTPSGGFYQTNPLLFSSSNPADFHPGDNAISVDVLNTVGESATGLIVEGKLTYRAGPAGKAEICVTKFNDLNGNGKQDPGEPPLFGWRFDIKDNAGNLIGKVITDNKKRACLTVPAPGTYTITEQIQAGWTPTTPNPQTVTVSPGQTVNLIFGNKKKVSDLPDLTIKKRVSCPGPATAQGNKCTITFTITNNGPGTFNGILTVQDSMTPSPAVAWAGGSTPTSTPQGWGWSCGLPLPLGCATTGPVTLAPPGNTTFSVDVYIPTGQYKNCATVKGYKQFPYSPSTLIQEGNSNNNEDCVGFVSGRPRVVGEGVPAVLPGKACDLEIKKSMSPSPLVSGQQVTITVTVTNVGNAPCPAGFNVADPKPAGLDFGGGLGWGWSGPTFPLPPGDTMTQAFTATVTAPPRSSVTNCATVSNPNDTNPANDKSCVTIKVK